MSLSLIQKTSSYKVAPQRIRSGTTETWATMLTGKVVCEHICYGSATASLRRPFRIRQAGTVTQVSFYTVSTNSNLIDLRVTIWRESAEGSKIFTKIGESENLITAGLIQGEHTYTLTSPIAGVHEGDYVGAYMKWTSGPPSGNFYYELDGSFYISSESADYKMPSPSTFTDNQLNNGCPLFVIYMNTPVLVGLGDSIMTGWPNNHSPVDTDNTYSPENAIPYKLAHLLGDISQRNSGIIGQTTTQIAARINTDCLNLSPVFILFEGGHNDLSPITSHNYDAVTHQIEENWITILDAAKSAGVIPVILTITPRSLAGTYPGTTLIMQTADIINTFLKANAYLYGALIVDTMTILGTFRTGGDAGNKWDLKPEYSYDGLHLNTDGNQALAEAIYDVLIEYGIAPDAALKYDKDCKIYGIVSADSAGKVENFNSDSFEEYNLANIAYYIQNSVELYDGYYSLWLPPFNYSGICTILLYVQIGVNPSAEDIFLGAVEINWDGTKKVRNFNRFEKVTTKTDNIPASPAVAGEAAAAIIESIGFDSYIDKTNPAQYQFVICKKGDRNTEYSRKDWKDSAGNPITGETKAVYQQVEPEGA